MRKTWIVLVVGISLFLSQSALAQYAGRTEVYPLQSMTLSTTQFLTGQTNGKPVTIAGELRIPVGKPGTRFPAVVLVHGSSGIIMNYDRWAHELNSIGVAVFLLDSFTGRGVFSTSTDQGQLDHLAMLYDAYRALDLLASHRQIDPQRIGILGFSKGGVAALYAAMDRFNASYGSKKTRFALYLAVYAPCYEYKDELKVDPKPIIVFHGIADDYVPMAPCLEYINRLRAAGVNAKLYGYPDAYHGFDFELLPAKLYLPTVQQAVKCKIREGENGVPINVETGKAFSLADTCSGLGATVGYNKEAHLKAIEDLKREVKSAFKIADK